MPHRTVPRLRPDSSQRHLIRIGRLSTVAFLLVAAGWAPFLTSFERVFSYIQEFWGLITPGVTVVFLSGLFWRRATASAAALGMAVTLPVTLVVKMLMPGFAFLDQMWVAALVIGALIVAVSLWRPESDTKTASGETEMSHEDAGRAADESDKDAAKEVAGVPSGDRDLLFDALCVGVVVLTIGLYVIFF